MQLTQLQLIGLRRSVKNKLVISAAVITHLFSSFKIQVCRRIDICDKLGTGNSQVSSVLKALG